MAIDIVMPNMGFDTQEARLVEWLKKPGDSIQKGEIIAIIESDKANVELESIANGILLEQLFPADTEIKVGAVIARVGQANEKPTPTPLPAKSATPVGARHVSPLPATPAPTATQPVEISPLARRMAQENNLDLSQVVGSGARGRITRDDIAALLTKDSPTNGKGGTGNGVLLALPKIRKAAREAGIDLHQVTPTGLRGEITSVDLQAFLTKATTVTPTPALAIQPEREAETQVEVSVPLGAQEIPLSRMRQLIGKRLSKSKRKAPHFYVTGEFDLEAALNSLPNGVKLNDVLQYLTVQSLLRVPELNATYEAKRLYQYGSINLAVAVARNDGLITPVLQGAERYSLVGLAQESRALIQRARDNRLHPNDLQGGTFTISNLGVIKQVEHFTAVINPPQVAILAIGTVKQRPVVINGGLFIHHTTHLTLSGDHRVVDGMHLARFMATFQEELDRFSGA